ARGTAAERDRRRPLQNRDLLRIERIAVIAAKVAHGVHKEIVTRGEAANSEAVSLRPALSCGQADAGDIAQRVAQGSRALVLNNVLWHHINGLWSVHQR